VLLYIHAVVRHLTLLVCVHYYNYPRETNRDNLTNIRRETSKHFRNKKREYLKGKIDKLATNSKYKNIRDLYRGIHDFRRRSQPRSNLLKDENGDRLADSHNICNRWKKCIQLNR
jgi:hypothetical protein